MNLKVYTEPTAEPVSLDEAKAHLRVDITADDTLIGAMLTAARQYVEMTARRALVTQTLDLYLAAFPSGDTITLPRPPLVSITSLTYVVEAGTTSTLATTVYGAETNTEPGFVYLKPSQTWPSDSLYEGLPVCVRYVAGYGDPPSVPEYYKQAIKLLIGHWYENREGYVIGQGFTPTTVPMAINSLIAFNRGMY